MYQRINKTIYVALEISKYNIKKYFVTHLTHLPYLFKYFMRLNYLI